MVRLITKKDCCRCVLLETQLKTFYSAGYFAKSKVETTEKIEISRFVGLGDIVEAIFCFLRFNVLWAWLHFKPGDWKCPSCKRRKNWLNKLWFFGPKQIKTIWLAAVYNSKRIDAQYPFVGYQDRHGNWIYKSLGEEHTMFREYENTKGLAYYENLYKL